jgi:hypothetical protein
MTIERVEFLVEEPSMKAALECVVPTLLGEVAFEVHEYQGKPDLLGKLPQRLKGYRDWMPDTWRICVIVDRDGDDCAALRARMDRIARRAGCIVRPREASGTWQVINRVAIEELEAWFFGDWEAVRAAYPSVGATLPKKRGFRHPDGIVGTWEALERVLQAAGYFRAGLRKIEAARAIAAHMAPDRNRSPSFIALRDALRALGSS